MLRSFFPMLVAKGLILDGEIIMTNIAHFEGYEDLLGREQICTKVPFRLRQEMNEAQFNPGPDRESLPKNSPNTRPQGGVVYRVLNPTERELDKMNSDSLCDAWCFPPKLFVRWHTNSRILLLTI